jgi:hypothetical protein
MGNNEDKQNVPKVGDESSTLTVKKKKPYVKPAFEWERVFEIEALACSKMTANSGCQPTKKVS